MTPEDREALQQLIQEMEAELNGTRPPIQHRDRICHLPAGTIRRVLALLADVLGSPRPEKDEKDQEAARVDSQRDPTDSPTATEVAPVSTRMPGARKVTEAELAPFKKVMEEEVIPAIIDAVHQRAVSAAETRNKVIFRGPPETIVDLRIAFETEQTLKAAWEKRAYEAEAEVIKLRASAEVVSPPPQDLTQRARK